MFLRRTDRRKNGKTHRYWNIVENKRLDDGRVVQRHVLYLGEINSSQAAAWRKAIEVFDEEAGGPGRWPCSPRIAARRRRTTHRWCGFGCPSCGCVGRGNGAPAGWPGSVAGAAARPVLGRAPAAEPEGNALGPGPAGPGRLSADRAGQRMAAASRVVRQQRDGRSAGRRLRPGRGAQALCLPRPAARPQGGAVLASDRALARSVQRRLRRAALRSDQHLLRGQRRGSAGGRQAPPRLQPRQAAGLPTSGDRAGGDAEGLPLAYEVLPGNTADSKTLRMFLGKIERNTARRGASG